MDLASPVGVVDLAPPVGVVDLAPPVGVVDLTPIVGENVGKSNEDVDVTHQVRHSEM